MAYKNKIHHIQLSFLATVVLSFGAPRLHAQTQGAKPLDQTLDYLSKVAGDWIKSEPLTGVSWGQLVLVGILLLFVLLIGELLRWALHRATRTQPDAAGSPIIPSDRSWTKLTLGALVPPLILLIWIWGATGAVALLLLPAGEETSPSLALRVLDWLKDAGEIAVAFWGVFRMIRVIERRLALWASKTDNKWDDVFVVLLGRALRLILPLISVILIVPTLDLPLSSQALFQKLASLLIIGAVGFILFQLTSTLETAVLNQFRIDVKDNLEARKVYTQVRVLKKIAVVVIVLLTTASMLMVFDSVRQLGTSILASAGVLGIIIGFAAQKSIATIVAGFQIAITQPIRLDDVVIVEGEWGRIEEITLTYVVVLIWDKRRLIVPITHFIENPFQNWTRVSSDLLGSIFLYLDYAVPLDDLRQELDRLLKASSLWDRKVSVIQVTDTKANHMEVRVLVSAADAGSAWDLRCEIREKLVGFLLREYPHSLPRIRAELVRRCQSETPVMA